jgi:hypothetical protein
MRFRARRRATSSWPDRVTSLVPDSSAADSHDVPHLSSVVDPSVDVANVLIITVSSRHSSPLLSDSPSPSSSSADALLPPEPPCLPTTALHPGELYSRSLSVESRLGVLKACPMRRSHGRMWYSAMRVRSSFSSSSERRWRTRPAIF